MRLRLINPFSQPDNVTAIASVYQQAFGGEPWNEGWRCPVCDAAFARVAALTVCSACVLQGSRVRLVEYWPMSTVLSDFYREMQKPDATCVIAECEERVIGFAWGYRVTADHDLVDSLDAPGLHEAISGDYFYLDECAVAPEFQGSGIGKQLVESIFREQPLARVLLRTMDHSRMCRLMTNMGGAIIQEISRGRVIMTLTLT